MLTERSQIEFSIPGMLSARVTIAQTVPPSEMIEKSILKNVGPVNNFMHSIFNQVNVFFNQKPVFRPNNAYAYRSYIETLLNYRSAAKKISSH